jgi:small conductance mechanosensitive channel
MLVSQIIIKFAEQLDSIKNGTYTKLSIQRRQKNLIFICDIIVMAFYLSILYAFLGCISVYMQERIFHEKIVIVGIILATIIAYKGFNELADSLLEKADGPDNCAGYKIKLQTFLPTVSAIFHIILFITAGLLVLANLGISIAPILATFTVFSAAVGLAAQDIIRSFLHGITFLIEEDLYVGAYVEINGMNGVIEKLSARVLYLRGDDGALYTIPYNVISVVTNCSKNYSYYYGTLQIHKEDDVDEISEILRQVVDGMQKEESYRDAILGKAEIFGLKPFDLFSLKIFWRVKTSPNAKGIIAKYEIYKRLYTMYKKHGISIPSANYIIHTDS